MAGTTAQRNGNGREFVTDASALFAPSHRRIKEVHLSEDDAHPEIVIVQAMAAGERRRFMARATKPDPDNHLQMINDLDWWGGERVHALMALCSFKPDGSPLFPAARERALRILAAGPEWGRSVTGDSDPDRLDDLDPAVESLLFAAADEVSIISAGAETAFASSPLARKTFSPTSGAPPSASPTLSES